MFQGSLGSNYWEEAGGRKKESSHSWVAKLICLVIPLNVCANVELIIDCKVREVCLINPVSSLPFSTHFSRDFPPFLHRQHLSLHLWLLGLHVTNVQVLDRVWMVSECLNYKAGRVLPFPVFIQEHFIGRSYTFAHVGPQLINDAVHVLGSQVPNVPLQASLSLSW